MAEELDLGAMMNKIMSDPNFAELMKNMKTSASGTASAESTAVKEENTAEMKSEAETVADGGGGAGSAISADKLSDLVQTLSPLIKNTPSHSGETERRNKLLAALKPYVNENRREVIDTVMSLSKITNILDIMPKGKL